MVSNDTFKFSYQIQKSANLFRHWMFNRRIEFDANKSELLVNLDSILKFTSHILKFSFGKASTSLWSEDASAGSVYLGRALQSGQFQEDWSADIFNSEKMFVYKKETVKMFVNKFSQFLNQFCWFKIRIFYISGH